MVLGLRVVTQRAGAAVTLCILPQCCCAGCKAAKYWQAASSVGTGMCCGLQVMGLPFLFSADVSVAACNGRTNQHDTTCGLLHRSGPSHS